MRPPPRELLKNIGFFLLVILLTLVGIAVCGVSMVLILAYFPLWLKPLAVIPFWIWCYYCAGQNVVEIAFLSIVIVVLVLLLLPAIQQAREKQQMKEEKSRNQEQTTEGVPAELGGSLSLHSTSNGRRTGTMSSMNTNIGGEMSNREEITRQALTLSPEDRAYVADVLERSLDSGPFATPEIAEAWSKEIDRRLAAYDRGETEAVDFETSNRRLREAFEARRRGEEVGCGTLSGYVIGGPATQGALASLATLGILLNAFSVL